jgi:predicted dehydrogenase
MASSQAGRYGIVGTGWRAEFFRHAALRNPSRFTVSGAVTRSANRAGDIEREWGVPAFRSVADLVTARRPEFLVVSVPRTAAPSVIQDAVDAGVPVLVETPPAPDLAGLRALWAAVGRSGLVQVAEQYPLLPDHAARSAVVRSGAIGRVSSVHVCSTHLYHAVALMRGLLGVDCADATVTAQAFTAPLADPVSRAGWSGDSTPKPTRTTLATIDFGSATGIYEFTDNQWHNPLRSERIVIRGSLGEIVDDRVIRLGDQTTVLESRIVRRQTGVGLNLEGFDLDHITYDGAMAYRNPFPGSRSSDEEIAVAGILARMTDWCRGDAPPPYPLAAASQDHLIGLAIEESLATGAPVTTTAQPWAC